MYLRDLGIGGAAAKALNTRSIVFTVAGIEVMAAVVLVLGKNYLAILIAQFVLAAASSALSIILTAYLQRRLSSMIRAGATSAISTAARLINIPLLGAFGVIANAHTVFGAAWVFVGLALIALIAIIRSPIHLDTL